MSVYINKYLHNANFKPLLEYTYQDFLKLFEKTFGEDTIRLVKKLEEIIDTKSFQIIFRVMTILKKNYEKEEHTTIDKWIEVLNKIEISKLKYHELLSTPRFRSKLSNEDKLFIERFNKIKTLDDLAAYIKKLEDIYLKYEKLYEAPIKYENQNFICYQIKTFEQASEAAEGTSWCIKNYDKYKDYVKSCELYHYVSKEESDRYLLAILNKTLLNEAFAFFKYIEDMEEYILDDLDQIIEELPSDRIAYLIENFNYVVNYFNKIFQIVKEDSTADLLEALDESNHSEYIREYIIIFFDSIISTLYKSNIVDDPEFINSIIEYTLLKITKPDAREEALLVRTKLVELVLTYAEKTDKRFNTLVTMINNPDRKVTEFMNKLLDILDIFDLDLSDYYEEKERDYMDRALGIISEYIDEDKHNYSFFKSNIIKKLEDSVFIEFADKKNTTLFSNEKYGDGAKEGMFEIIRGDSEIINRVNDIVKILKFREEHGKDVYEESTETVSYILSYFSSASKFYYKLFQKVKTLWERELDDYEHELKSIEKFANIFKTKNILYDYPNFSIFQQNNFFKYIESHFIDNMADVFNNKILIKKLAKRLPELDHVTEFNIKNLDFSSQNLSDKLTTLGINILREYRKEKYGE